jgi:hypothetical protein
MAVVGTAEIIVRAITKDVAKDIRTGFRDVEAEAKRAGVNAGRNFSRSMNMNIDPDSGLGRLMIRLKEISPNAKQAADAFTALVRKGYYVQSGLGGIVGAIGSIIGGLGALIGAAGAASAAVVALGSSLASTITGFALMRYALGGIGAALQDSAGGGGGGGVSGVDQALRNLALTVERNVESIANANNNLRDAQLGLNEAYEQGAEFLQQLGFQAEEAALSQERAGMSLEEARENLARVQDLPPNSRARREAEIAFREADLNYRQAVDANSDLAKEQDKYSSAGIEGTEAVLDAKERLLQAEEDLARTIRDNLRAQEQAEEALAQARRGGGGAASAQQSAYDKLTESQKRFVNFLKKEIIPETKNLKEAVARGFLPVLETQLRRLKDGGFFEALETGYEAVGVGLGKATKSFNDAFINNGGIDAMQEFFLQTAKVMPAVGTSLGSIASYVLSLFKAAEPLTARFTEWVTGVTGGWAASLDTEGEIRQMQDFYRKAGDMAAMFGDVFGNVFDAIGDWIDLNLSPGSGGYQIVEWLQEITNGFANIDRVWLDSYFRQSSRNFIEIGDSLGILFNVITRAGGDENIEELFENLNQGAVYLANIGQEALKVAPEIGILLLNITKLLSAFADSAATQAFFNVINTMTGGFAAVAKAAQAIIEPVSAVFGFIAGFGSFARAMSKIKDVAAGFLEPVLEGFKNFKEVYAVAVATIEGSKGTYSGFKTAFQQMGDGITAAEGGLEKFKGGLSTFGGASKVAFKSLIESIGPGGLIELGFAAISTAVVVIGGLIEENMRKKMEAATEAFEDGTDAVSLLNSVLEEGDWTGGEYIDLTLGDIANAAKEAAAQIKKTEEAIGGAAVTLRGELVQAGIDARDPNTSGAEALKAYKTAITSVGDSLAQVATTDLALAQERFRKLRDEMGFNNQQLIDTESLTGDFRDTLIAQADALDISIMGTNGLVDEQKLMAFAVGEGDIAIRRQNEALRDNDDELSKLISATANTTDAAAAGWAEGTFNLEAYNKALEDNVAAIADSFANTQALISRGFDQDFISAFTEGMNPAQAAASLSQLVDASDETLSQIKNNLLLSGEEYSTAMIKFTEGTATETEESAKRAFENNLISLETFLGVMSGELESFDTKVTIGTDTKAFDNLAGYAAVAADKAKTTVKVGAASSPKKGTVSIAGIAIPFEFSGFKNGGLVGALNMQGFANGGMVTGGGYGGGRSDRIPAMLSNGEYVVNSGAAARNLSTLNAINYGGASGSMGSTVNITVNPSPGMDERELASVVSQELMRQMRRGSI